LYIKKIHSRIGFLKKTIVLKWPFYNIKKKKSRTNVSETYFSDSKIFSVILVLYFLFSKFIKTYSKLFSVILVLYFFIFQIHKNFSEQSFQYIKITFRTNSSQNIFGSEIFSTLIVKYTFLYF